MKTGFYHKENYPAYAMILVFLALLALGMKGVDPGSARQEAGWINFALGGTLLAAFVIAKLAGLIGLPNLTGYIAAGILAGPFVSGFLTPETVDRLKLIDELALSVIALAAGAELELSSMKKRAGAILLNIVLITVLVFAGVSLFIIIFGPLFSVTKGFTASQLTAFAILLGVICVARSPSSTIAIINECRAKGPFTDTILSVTIVTDILIIIMFTAALSSARVMVADTGSMNWSEFGLLGGEIAVSLFAGVLLGKAASAYIKHIRRDFLIFLVFLAFFVSRASMGFNEYTEAHVGISLHLEPLLICMSAGFFIRNATGEGEFFMENLDRVSMPVYVLFFSLAGAALNFNSLMLCWPLALAVVAVRAAGLFAGSWMAGSINRDPVPHRRCAWMTYLTQAGVAIGLSQLAMREFPEIGTHLNTLVLAVIAVNQIIGPVLFKLALRLADEEGRSRRQPV
ncbi:MAG: cation:proton antiporter [Desulfosalsimonas sp.]